MLIIIRPTGSLRFLLFTLYYFFTSPYKIFFPHLNAVFLRKETVIIVYLFSTAHNLHPSFIGAILLHSTCWLVVASSLLSLPTKKKKKIISSIWLRDKISIFLHDEIDFHFQNEAAGSQNCTTVKVLLRCRVKILLDRLRVILEFSVCFFPWKRTKSLWQMKGEWEAVNMRKKSVERWNSITNITKLSIEFVICFCSFPWWFVVQIDIGS